MHPLHTATQPPAARANRLPPALLPTVLVLALAGCGKADVPPPPTGEPILFVDGAITHTNVGAEAQFDLESLAAQPSETFTTSTTWTEGTPTFTGVPLKALLEAVGATGDTVTASWNSVSRPVRMVTVVA